jgi:crossover junction endodeoxyribonuclease RuvC
MARVRIGIDPGLTGAIAIIHEDGVLLEDMPALQVGRGVVKREVNGAALAHILRPYIHDSQAVLERTSARPGQGVASMFSMGVSRGVVLGVLGALGIPFIEAAPTTWKRAYGLSGKDKSASRHEAIKLFPKLAVFLKHERDHNRAEALLLAQWLPA